MMNFSAIRLSGSSTRNITPTFYDRASLFFEIGDLYRWAAARYFRMQTSDIAALINRVAMGDRAAFTTLYQATSPRLFAICLRVLRDRPDAEEALQEIYIKVWQRARSFAVTTGAPSTWLAAIARNHAIDILRARKPVADDIDDKFDLVDEATATPEQHAVTADEGRRIDHCMRQLDTAHAHAVRRAYVEGLSYTELADDLQVPLNTVRTWLRRSLLKLRECLQR
jgi:RNA polymerase sigma-70 factor, ECF subfamily